VPDFRFRRGEQRIRRRRGHDRSHRDERPHIECEQRIHADRREHVSQQLGSGLNLIDPGLRGRICGINWFGHQLTGFDDRVHGLGNRQHRLGHRIDGLHGFRYRQHGFGDRQHGFGHWLNGRRDGLFYRFGGFDRIDGERHRVNRSVGSRQHLHADRRPAE
jgi:hypothetical protein